MSYQKIIDIHNHIYPKKIAQKAISNIGEFYDVPMKSNKGTSEDLLISGKEINVEKYIVHSVSTTVHQVSIINDFIAGELQKYKEFVGYATLHPDMTEDAVAKEIERVLAKGFKGIKLHPDFQRFDIDDNKADKIYSIAQDSLPILFHTGDDRFDYSSPERLAKTAKKFPKLKCIAAHFGGYNRWSEIDV
ncbi:MAG: amidohydrolase family protein, partial [Bacillota bacterium]